MNCVTIVHQTERAPRPVTHTRVFALANRCFFFLHARSAQDQAKMSKLFCRADVAAVNCLFFSRVVRTCGPGHKGAAADDVVGNFLIYGYQIEYKYYKCSIRNFRIFAHSLY